MCKERGGGSWIESKANANTRRFGHGKSSRQAHSLKEPIKHDIFIDLNRIRIHHLKWIYVPREEVRNAA
jgi:hypothetical protein